MRKGFKTTEFYVLVVGVLAAIAKHFGWVDFPSEALLSIGAWLTMRLSQKGFVPNAVDTAKRSWRSTEFWVAIVTAIVKWLFPDIDPAIITGAMVYIIGRPAVKIAKDTVGKK